MSLRTQKAHKYALPCTRNRIVFGFSMGCAAWLVACGDGRPDAALDSATFVTELSAKSTASVPQRGVFMPLASEALQTTLEKYSDVFTPAALVDLNLASSLGDLPERIEATGEGLGLVGTSFDTQIPGLFGQLPHGTQWTTTSRPRPLGLKDSGSDEELQEFQLTYNNIPIHGARVKSIRDTASNTTTWLSGSVPPWMSNSGSESPRSTAFAFTASVARQHAAAKLGFAEWRFHSPSKIYIPQSNQSLLPAYVFIVSAERADAGAGPRIPIEIAINADIGEIIWQRPLAMHAVTGQASLYVENIKSAGNQLSPVSLPGLLGDGSKMSHSLFDVFNCRQRSRAEENGNRTVCTHSTHAIAGGDYTSISYSNEVYDELIAFAAVTKAMSWFNAIDQSGIRTDWDATKWPGTRANFGLEPSGSKNGSETRLGIFVRTRTPVSTANQCGDMSTPDNAQYLPASSSGIGSPEILIGYGGAGVDTNGCYKLKELGKDMDVVMHEFGHHIVFRGLSNAKSQSVAMHEGLADYFTYAISGNNQLAENAYSGGLRRGVIPNGTTFKTFKAKSGGGYYSVMDLLTAPHTVGEFWSGILWKIRTEMGRDSGGGFKFDKILWDSIDLLKSDAGLYEGMVSLSESAKRYGQRFGDDSAALQKIVQDMFVTYGFARYTSSGEFAAVAELAGAVSSVSDQPITKVSKSRRWGCGDVAFAAADTSSPTPSRTHMLLVLCLLAMPFLTFAGSFIVRRVSQQHAVRVRRARRRN